MGRKTSWHLGELRGWHRKGYIIAASQARITSSQDDVKLVDFLLLGTCPLFMKMSWNNWGVEGKPTSSGRDMAFELLDSAVNTMTTKTKSQAQGAAVKESLLRFFFQFLPIHKGYNTKTTAVTSCIPRRAVSTSKAKCLLTQKGICYRRGRNYSLRIIIITPTRRTCSNKRQQQKCWNPYVLIAPFSSSCPANEPCLL